MLSPAPAPPRFWATRGFAIAWLLGVLLSLPALGVGALNDDFFQHLALEGAIPFGHFGPTTLYDFTGGQQVLPWIERGFLPWQTHTELSLRFFRPLASLSITFDHELFGRAQLPGHVQNLAWFVALLAVGVAWFKELLPTRQAGLASVLFAVAGGHTMNIAWTSARHLPISAVFGGLAVWLHVRQRSLDQPGAGAWVAWAPLVLALGASEAALASVALIVSYEILGRTDSLGSRLKALAGPVSLGIGYLGYYVLAGYGVKHSGLYLSPFSQPFEFAQAAASRVPILVGELTGAVPAFLWGAAGASWPVLVGLGCLFTALVVVLLVSAPLDASERRRVLWLGAGALAGVLPAVGGVLNGRMLILPCLAAAPIVATAIDATLQQSARHRLAKAGACVLLVMHLGIGPLVRVGLASMLAGVSQQQRALAQEADMSACPIDATGLIVTGADPSLSLSGATSLAYYRPELIDRFRNIHVLSMAPQRQTLERSVDGSLVLTVEDGPRQTTLFEQLFRDEPLTPGYALDLQKLGATVVETERGLPTRVNFRVPEKSCLLLLRDRRLVSAALPSLGRPLVVPHEPGPYGL